MMSHPTKVHLLLNYVLKKTLYVMFSSILSLMYFIIFANNAPADKECLEQTLNSIIVKVYV